MNNESPLEEINLAELANTPLSDLVEPEWLELPEIEQQDLELPYDYLQDLVDRGVIGEDMSEIDIDSRLLEGLEREQTPFDQTLITQEESRNQDLDFGR